KLKGIGTFYAKRIVNFREKLGGFYSIQQVGETFGLPDSTFQKIQPLLQASPVFRKIKVNAATLEELKSHPYFSNFQATVLFNYRQQHGNFTNLESLKKIAAAFKDSDWERLEPYLSFE
ncbi:MAG: helix-hairpin-helix domain-containing protein, partial [Bacteroidota bacterium]